MTEKTMEFKGANKDLKKLSDDIVQRLSKDGYKTQANSGSSGIVIQAKKEGVLRDIIAANRAFTIMISGKPNDFNVRIGIGKFVQNLAVTAVETLILSELFLPVDVSEMLWTKHVEQGISKEIISVVGTQPASTKGAGVAL